MGYLEMNYALLGFPCSSAGKESACSAGALGSIPGSGRAPGGGHVRLSLIPGRAVLPLHGSGNVT